MCTKCVLKMCFSLSTGKAEKEAKPGSAASAGRIGFNRYNTSHNSSWKWPNSMLYFFRRSERLSLYLELADCLRADGQTQEAARVMQEAMKEFSGSGEELRLTVANADLALERGETDSALSILR